MATIKEDFVSFETAKLLKEKGFDNVSSIMYKENGEMCINPKSASSWRLKYWYPCLTLQMAMKWLREKYNLFIQITVDFSDGAYPMYDVCVVDLARCTSIIVNGYNRYTYTQACETAIKYCLEYLI